VLRTLGLGLAEARVCGSPFDPKRIAIDALHPRAARQYIGEQLTPMAHATPARAITQAQGCG
jgi:hypothetical protein